MAKYVKITYQRRVTALRNVTSRWFWSPQHSPKGGLYICLLRPVWTNVKYDPKISKGHFSYLGSLEHGILTTAWPRSKKKHLNKAVNELNPLMMNFT